MDSEWSQSVKTFLSHVNAKGKGCRGDAAVDMSASFPSFFLKEPMSKMAMMVGT